MRVFSTIQTPCAPHPSVASHPGSRAYVKQESAMEFPSVNTLYTFIRHDDVATRSTVGKHVVSTASSINEKQANVALPPWCESASRWRLWKRPSENHRNRRFAFASARRPERRRACWGGERFTAPQRSVRMSSRGSGARRCLLNSSHCLYFALRLCVSGVLFRGFSAIWSSAFFSP